MFAPLRSLGVPESVIDVVEPSFRVIVELGYDRDIRPWEPTPARLIPSLNPGKVAADLVAAVGEGINNAAALIGSKAPLTHSRNANHRRSECGCAADAPGSDGQTFEGIGRDGTDGATQVLTAVGSQLPHPPAVIRGDLGASPRQVGRELAAQRDQINKTIGAVKSVIGDGRTISSSPGQPHRRTRDHRQPRAQDASAGCGQADEQQHQEGHDQRL